MSSQASSAEASSFILELLDDRPLRLGPSLLPWGGALAVHLLAASWTVAPERAPREAAPVLVVELAPEAALSPAAVLVPPPAAVAAPSPPQRSATERRVANFSAPAAHEAAHAGALITAKADAPASGAEEPVDFTHDPRAASFGAGIVALGGKAQTLFGGRPDSGQAAAVGRAASLGQAGEALTPVSDLSRKPALNESDPCRGYFPAAATGDAATAGVIVTIRKDGAVSGVQLLTESPPAQGFGAAARACMSHKRFNPGLDRNGNPAATAIRVNVRFSR